MNSKQTKTLQAIFSKPTPSILEWAKLKSLLLALGCNVVSWLRFEYNGIITAVHRPHPAKEAKPYQVEQARDFLTAIGVKP